jgi:hypothetical protein
MTAVVMWKLFLLVRCRSSAFSERIFKVPYDFLGEKLLKWVKYKEMLLRNMYHNLYQKNRIVAKECECTSK